MSAHHMSMVPSISKLREETMKESSMRMRTSVVGAMVLLGVGAAAAVSAVGDEMISACQDQKGNLRIVVDPAECTKQESALQWNKTGPVGPQGPVGAPGATGEAGPAGPAGPVGPALFTAVLQGGDYTPSPPNGGCTFADEWRECARVTVDVPAGNTYVLAIDSDGSYFAYNKSTNVRVCTSVRASTTTFQTTATLPDSCHNQPTGITLNNSMGSVGTNGVREVSGGSSGASYVVSTAVRPDAALDFYNGYRHEVVHTLVTVSEKR